MTRETRPARRILIGLMAVAAAIVIFASGLWLGAEFSADQPLAPAIVAGTGGLVALLLGRWGLRSLRPARIRC